MQLSGVKVVNTNCQGNLKKQEAVLRDTTSSVKVILWEDYVETLEDGKTYLLENLRLKVTKSERYLNTPKSKNFT